MNPPRKKNRSLAERDKPALERVGRRRRHPGHRDLRRFLAEFLMKTAASMSLVKGGEPGPGRSRAEPRPALESEAESLQA
jgi:hypothetical protein